MNGLKLTLFLAAALACVAVAAAGLPAGAAAQKAKASRAAARGREVYAAHCVRCHGEDGRGGTRLADIVEVPDMTDPEWLKARGDARMAASVANGRGQMPAFRRKLSKQEIAAAISYVRTLGR